MLDKLYNIDSARLLKLAEALKKNRRRKTGGRRRENGGKGNELLELTRKISAMLYNYIKVRTDNF